MEPVAVPPYGKMVVVDVSTTPAALIVAIVLRVEEESASIILNEGRGQGKI